jgi:hypothetical protein
MKSLSAWSVIIVCMALWMPPANARPVGCPAVLPAGVVIRVFPDEKLTAGLSAGPTILTVGSDVRFFPNRPPLLARGSKILGTIVESKQAGRFHGKARLRMALTSILTSDFCEYPIDAKVVEVGRHKVKDDVVWGRGHARRDVVALLFPPTTVYQLLRIPGRGPKLELNGETPLTIKLMQPVSLGESSSLKEKEIDESPALRSKVDATERDLSGPCPSIQATSPGRTLIQRASVMRPVRNLTPYHVSVYLDRRPVAIVPPCYGPSMIPTPVTEFNLEATAALLTTGGQKQVKMRMVPSAGGNGWDIVTTDAAELAVARTN